MVPINRKKISLYEEAKNGLSSLVLQTATVFFGFIVMLLLTVGNPSSFAITIAFISGIAFVAWCEQKRVTKLWKKPDNSLDNIKKRIRLQKRNRIFYVNGVAHGASHTGDSAIIHDKRNNITSGNDILTGGLGSDIIGNDPIDEAAVEEVGAAAFHVGAAAFHVGGQSLTDAGLKDDITKIFKGWGSDLLEEERKALRNKSASYSVSDWKAEHIAYVAVSGALTGAIGEPIGLAAIIPDLLWCKKVGTQGCLGIGHIKAYEVDYDQDMNLILAIWSGIAEVSVSVPIGKVGIKVSDKVLPKVAGKVLDKLLFKGDSKIGEKLASKTASKAASKLTAKLAAKSGVAWIPLIGGAVSGGINWWLLSGLLDAAETYYKSDYIVFNDDELL